MSNNKQICNVEKINEYTTLDFFDLRRTTVFQNAPSNQVETSIVGENTI